MKDENKNIEKENYRYEITKENYRYEITKGKYRDIDKINDNFRRLGIEVDKI